MGLGVWRWEVSWLSYTLTPKQWSVIAGDSDAHLKLLESPSCFDIQPSVYLAQFGALKTWYHGERHRPEVLAISEVQGLRKQHRLPRI